MIKYLTEFLGTFFFLSVILQTGKKIPIKIAPLAIGLALVLIIIFGGQISGGHFNPAVSTMFFLNKTLPANDLVPYIIAQILGAIAANYFLSKKK